MSFVRKAIFAYLLAFSILGAGPASAQIPNDLGRFVGGLIQSATVEATRADWRRLPQAQLNCIDQTLSRQGSSVENFIRQGIRPSDGAVSGYVQSCRNVSAAPQTVQSNDYTVDGMLLGARAMPSLAASNFRCAPSTQFPGFFWCQRKRQRFDSSGTVTISNSVMTSPDGLSVYVNQYIEPAHFGPNDVSAEIARLSARFGVPTQTLHPRRGPEAASATIVTWGDIRLEQVDESDRQILASGGSVRNGVIVDYLGDFEKSAKVGLPIYRLAGGKGYVWSMSSNEAGVGHLRLTASDPSQYLRHPDSRIGQPPSSLQGTTPDVSQAPAASATDTSQRDAAADAERKAVAERAARLEDEAKKANERAEAAQRESHAQAERFAAERQAREQAEKARLEAEGAKAAAEAQEQAEKARLEAERAKAAAEAQEQAEKARLEAEKAKAAAEAQIAQQDAASRNQTLAIVGLLLAATLVSYLLSRVDFSFLLGTVPRSKRDAVENSAPLAGSDLPPALPPENEETNIPPHVMTAANSTGQDNVVVSDVPVLPLEEMKTEEVPLVENSNKSSEDPMVTSDTWFYESHGERKGPVSASEIEKMIQEKALQSHSLIWNRSFANTWKRVADTEFSTKLPPSESVDLPPPLPKMAIPVNFPDTEQGKRLRQFLDSELTKTLVGENIEYYRGQWERLLMRSNFAVNDYQKQLSWNWAAFFFNGYWLLYRKAYLVGGCYCAFQAVLGLIFRDNFAVSIAVSILGALAIGVFGNSFYLRQTYEKWFRLSGVEASAQENAAARDGGTNLKLALGGAAILTILGGIMAVTLGPTLSCSSQVTRDTVAQIARKQIDKDGYMMFVVNSGATKITLDAIRTQGTENGKLKCAASISYDITFKAQGGDTAIVKNAIEQALHKDIIYNVEKTDNNDNIYVTVFGLAQ